MIEYNKQHTDLRKNVLNIIIYVEDFKVFKDKIDVLSITKSIPYFEFMYCLLVGSFIV